jgi:hypothetical protein
MAHKVDASKFGSSAPKLMPEDLEEDVAILTVAQYEEVSVDDDNAEGGKRQSATLKFVETGDKVVWLNKGMVETLVEQLGDDADKWAGQKVPVERHVASFGNKKYPKVRVMVSDEWDKTFKEAGVRRARPATSGKR